MSLPKGVVGAGWSIEVDRGAIFEIEMADSGAKLDLMPLLLGIYGPGAAGPTALSAEREAREELLCEIRCSGVRFAYQGRAVEDRVAHRCVDEFVRGAVLDELRSEVARGSIGLREEGGMIQV